MNIDTLAVDTTTDVAISGPTKIKKELSNEELVIKILEIILTKFSKNKYNEFTNTIRFFIDLKLDENDYIKYFEPLRMRDILKNKNEKDKLIKYVFENIFKGLEAEGILEQSA